MKFLLRPEFLTAVAAWVCALAAHLGWSLPAELVYGAASLISIASGGVAVKRNKKNGTSNGSSSLSVLLIGSLALAPLAGCNSTTDYLRAGQSYLSRYIVDATGDLEGKVRFNAEYAFIDAAGEGSLQVIDQANDLVILDFPISDAKDRAFKLVITEGDDGKPDLAFQTVDPSIAKAALGLE